MASWYNALEILDNGQGTGKFRMVEHNTSCTRFHGLCDHEHDSKDEARECPDAKEYLDRVFPPQPNKAEIIRVCVEQIIDAIPGERPTDDTIYKIRAAVLKAVEALG